MKVIMLMLICIPLFLSTCLFSQSQAGEDVSETFETPHPYKGEEGVVWEKKFHSPKANSITLHFVKFSLAKGDYVEISSPDGRYKCVYCGKGKEVVEIGESKKAIETKVTSEFWTAPIPGDTAVAKLVSVNRSSDYGFRGDKWAFGHNPGFKSAGAKTAKAAAPSGGYAPPYAFHVSDPYTPWPGYTVGDGSAFKILDINGNGLVEGIHFAGWYVHVWWPNNPNIGTWHPGYYVGDPQNIKTGDFNGDGKGDLVHLDRGFIRTWFSNGNGTFSTIGWYPGFHVSSSETIKTGDFNRDKKTDLVHFDGYYIRVWLSNGNGTYTSKAYLPGFWVGGGERFKPGDFNEDGRTDLVFFGDTFVRVLRSKGDGAFTVLPAWKPWSGYDVGNGDRFILGRFNGDGRTDMVHVYNSHVNTWRADGDGTFTVRQFRPGIWVGDGSRFRTGDFNRDGRTDLVYFDNEYTYTWISDDYGTFTVHDKWRPWSAYWTGGAARFKTFINQGRGHMVHFCDTYVHFWMDK